MDESLVEEEFGLNLNEESLEEVNGFVVFVVNTFEIVASAFVFIVFIFSFLFRTVGVDGNSMNNTLQDKDRLFILSPILHKPKEKDIVILNAVDTLDVLIIKRVIATEGQTVDLKRNGSVYDVYVDGVKLNEDYIKEPINLYHVHNLKYPITIPKGYVFVMGDNRNDSTDSRALGPINVEKIKGSVLLRLTPLRNFKVF